MKVENINWEQIQNYYNKGFSWRNIISEFGISNRMISNAIRLKLLVVRSKSEAISLSRKKNPVKHTEETKKKISEARKKYLLENPDKVPYLLNHSRNESYPEKYFTELFEKEQIIVTKALQIGLYELDFCIPDKKIDIEIDGSQHYYDEKIVESDKRRTKYLEDNGWDVIRVNWAEFQKQNFEEKSKYIKQLINYINRLTNEKPTITYIKFEKGKNLCSCGKQKWKESKNCKECYNSLKKERPTIEILLMEVKELGYCAVGRKYGVSDNAIRKWLK